MKITFLGTGTSQGVPTIGGKNRGLDLSNPKNWRTRTSACIEIGNKVVLVDAAPELRLQCLKNDIRRVDIFILTHGHNDHIAGMDDLRRFCDMIPGNRLPVYSNKYGLKRVEAMFPYALMDKPVSSGYPCFEISPMPDLLEISETARILSAPLPHGNMETLGLVFEEGPEKIAYFTDCKKLTPRALELAHRADLAALDFLRPKPHPSHMCVSEALDAARAVRARKTYFIHTTSRIDYDSWERRLPDNCHIAYDGLRVDLSKLREKAQ